MALPGGTDIHITKLPIGLVLVGLLSLKTASASRVILSSSVRGYADSQDLVASVEGCYTVRPTGGVLLH